MFPDWPLFQAESTQNHQKNLRVEKAGHPEDSWTPGEAPGPELAVSLKQLGEPAI